MQVKWVVVAFWDHFGLLAFFDWELLCDDAEMKKICGTYISV